MQNEMLISLLSFLGTAIGSLAGIIASAQLTKYRLAQLEKKVEAHNNLVVRMTAAERDIKSAHKRIDEIKEEIA